MLSSCRGDTVDRLTIEGSSEFQPEDKLRWHLKRPIEHHTKCHTKHKTEYKINPKLKPKTKAKNKAKKCKIA